MTEKRVAERSKRSRGRPKSLFKEPQGGTVQALDRGLTFLRDLADNGAGTLADLSLRNDLPVSTAHRILATLAQHGFAEMDERTQEWFIGMEAFRVGSIYLDRTNVVEAARPVMRRLMESTGETANLAIADKGDVVFISQIETHNPIRAFFRPGTRGHMHASGIGKALLSAMPKDEAERIFRSKGLPEFTEKTLTKSEAMFADLATTAQRGWSFDDDERYLGMRCVAAPIYNAYGEAIAGISVSGPSVRLPDDQIPKLGTQLREAAAEVTKAIGGVLPSNN